MNESFEPEELSDLIDGRLGEAETESVRSRLASRPDASSLLEDLQTGRRRMRELPRLVPSQDLAQRILQSIRQEATDWSPSGELREQRKDRREPALASSSQSNRYFSLAGMRAIAGILAIAALILLSLVVFPRWAGPPIGDLARNPSADAGPDASQSVAQSTVTGSSRSANDTEASGMAGASDQRRAGDDSIDPAVASIDRDQESDLGDPAAPELQDRVDNVAPAWGSGRTIVEGADGNPRLSEGPRGSAAESGLADSASALPPTAGAEFLMVVHLPTMETPTEAWIESLFRPAEPPADDPTVDGFESRLSELRTGEHPPLADSRNPPEVAAFPPAQDRYVVQANADLLRLIINRMPSATIECSVLEPVGGSSSSPEALPAPNKMYRMLKSFKEGSESKAPSGELPRADRILESLGIDKSLPREYCILFEFRFGR